MFTKEFLVLLTIIMMESALHLPRAAKLKIYVPEKKTQLRG